MSPYSWSCVTGRHLWPHRMLRRSILHVRELLVFQKDGSTSETSGGELIKTDHLAALLESKGSYFSITSVNNSTVSAQLLSPRFHVNKWLKSALFKQRKTNGATVWINKPTDGAGEVFIPAHVCFPLLLYSIGAANQNGWWLSDRRERWKWSGWWEKRKRVKDRGWAGVGGSRRLMADAARERRSLCFFPPCWWGRIALKTAVTDKSLITNFSRPTSHSHLSRNNQSFHFIHQILLSLVLSRLPPHLRCCDAAASLIESITIPKSSMQYPSNMIFKEEKHTTIYPPQTERCGAKQSRWESFNMLSINQSM